MAELILQVEFIQKFLPNFILDSNEEFRNHSIIKCTATHLSQLDGFMASIYAVELVLRNPNEETEIHQIIVKTMKGDRNFREKTDSSLQFANEIFTYKFVIPSFQQFLKENSTTSINPNCWIPKVYYADFKIFEGLSVDYEAILAMENLTPKGFRLGPKNEFDEAHLSLMIENIASYHAVSYAMKLKNPSKFNELMKGLIPFEFLSKDGKEMKSYNILHKIGLERIFTIVEKRKEVLKDDSLVSSLRKIKEKLYPRPVVVMQNLIAQDETFCVFLHGDYYRNNVLYRYQKNEGFECPQEIRMFDFQETRVASPVIDLSVFMYLNMPSIEVIWDKLLELYHKTYMKYLIEILKCEQNDPKLQPYSYENFIAHVEKYAFYGVITAFASMPFTLGTPEENEKIAHIHETDLESEELRQIMQISGGQIIDDRLLSVLLHSHKKGYLKIFN